MRSLFTNLASPKVKKLIEKLQPLTVSPRSIEERINQPLFEFLAYPYQDAVEAYYQHLANGYQPPASPSSGALESKEETIEPRTNPVTDHDQLSLSWVAGIETAIEGLSSIRKIQFYVATGFFALMNKDSDALGRLQAKLSKIGAEEAKETAPSEIHNTVLQALAVFAQHVPDHQCSHLLPPTDKFKDTTINRIRSDLTNDLRGALQTSIFYSTLLLDPTHLMAYLDRLPYQERREALHAQCWHRISQPKSLLPPALLAYERWKNDKSKHHKQFQQHQDQPELSGLFPFLCQVGDIEGIQLLAKNGLLKDKVLEERDYFEPTNLFTKPKALIAAAKSDHVALFQALLDVEIPDHQAQYRYLLFNQQPSSNSPANSSESMLNTLIEWGSSKVFFSLLTRFSTHFTTEMMQHFFTLALHHRRFDFVASLLDHVTTETQREFIPRYLFTGLARCKNPNLVKTILDKIEALGMTNTLVNAALLNPIPEGLNFLMQYQLMDGFSSFSAAMISDSTTDKPASANVFPVFQQFGVLGLEKQALPDLTNANELAIWLKELHQQHGEQALFMLFSQYHFPSVGGHELISAMERTTLETQIRAKTELGTHALTAAAASSLEGLKALLSHPATKTAAHEMMNTPDHYGRTPLTYAITHFTNAEQFFETIQLLIDHGADVNQADRHGQTPLQLLCRYDTLQGQTHSSNANTQPASDHSLIKERGRVFSLLLDKGAKLDCTAEGMKALTQRLQSYQGAGQVHWVERVLHITQKAERQCLPEQLPKQLSEAASRPTRSQTRSPTTDFWRHAGGGGGGSRSPDESPRAFIVKR